jgi:hypothetical protein
LVAIVSVTQNVVFSHAPGVDGIFANCIRVLSRSHNLNSAFPNLGFIITLLQILLPKTLN